MVIESKTSFVIAVEEVHKGSNLIVSQTVEGELIPQDEAGPTSVDGLAEVEAEVR